MNYQRLYDQLVAKAQKRGTPEGYFERHHIIPRSMGGSNDKNNLVDFTAREHFIAHFLLAKIHGGTQWAAVTKMSGNKNKSGFLFKSRLYEIARVKNALYVSESQKGIKKSKESVEKMQQKLTGRKLSDDHKKAISLGGKNIKKKPLSDSHRAKIGKCHKGKKISDEHKKAISDANKKRTMPEWQKAKLIAATKARHAANRAAKALAQLTA
jgi:hypothetical protein